MHTHLYTHSSSLAPFHSGRESCALRYPPSVQALAFRSLEGGTVNAVRAFAAMCSLAAARCEQKM